MMTEELKENNRQWAIRIKEWRDSERLKFRKMRENKMQDSPAYEWQRGRCSALCDLLKAESTEDFYE